MALNWKRDEIEKLIYAIQQHPCLFNIKSAEYLDRKKKAHAFNDVLKYLNTFIPSVKLEDIKQKWKNVRSQYVRELRMINYSKKYGSGMSDIYVPKLWCFNQLAFLKTNTRMKMIADNVEETELYNVESIPEILIEGESFSEEPPKKKTKHFADINLIRKDLDSLRSQIIERKKEKKFAWLGTLVTNVMEEIEPDEQDDAAWVVQCLMRRLAKKKVERESFSTSSSSTNLTTEKVQTESCLTSSSNSTKDILELSMAEAFDEDDLI